MDRAERRRAAPAVLVAVALVPWALACATTPEERARQWAVKPLHELEQRQELSRLGAGDRAEAAIALRYCFSNPDVNARRVCIERAREWNVVQLVPELLRGAERDPEVGGAALSAAAALDVAAALPVAVQLADRPAAGAHDAALNVACAANDTAVLAAGVPKAALASLRERCAKREQLVQCRTKLFDAQGPCHADCRRVGHAMFLGAQEKDDADGVRAAASYTGDCLVGCDSALNTGLASCGAP